jgi:predicted P-loop ATPase
LLPRIEGQPKAGLCEYFKVGYTDENYKELLDSALKPEDLLQEWPNYWSGLSDRHIIRCCRLAACLSVLYLPDLESEAFVRQLGERFKAQGIRARDLQREAKRWKARRLKKRVVCRLEQDYRLIENRLSKGLRYNQLLNKPELFGEPFPAEESRLRLIIDYGLPIKSGKEDCLEIVLKLARKKPFNPIAEYLEQCYQEHGHDTSILDGIAERYFGNNEDIAQEQLTKTLIRAVARAYKPGCKADEVTVLAGPQGFNKSEFLKALASPAWFCDDFSDPRDKDHLLKLHESWIIEWAELHGLTKREATKVKAFITTSRDRIRRPYGREAEQIPRPSIMVGTSNDSEFLTDPTGNRRWWIIKVNQKIPLELAREERDRIWGAAVALHKQGVTWWLDADQESQAEVVRKEYEAVDAWHELIESYLDSRSEVSVNDIFANCLDIEPGQQDNPKRSRITNVLRRLGWETQPNAVRRNGQRVRLWVKKYLGNSSPSQSVVSAVSGVPEVQNPSTVNSLLDTAPDTVPEIPRVSSVPTVLEGMSKTTSDTMAQPLVLDVLEHVSDCVSAKSVSGKEIQPPGTPDTLNTPVSERSKKSKYSEPIEVYLSQETGWQNGARLIRRYESSRMIYDKITGGTTDQLVEIELLNGDRKHLPKGQVRRCEPC